MNEQLQKYIATNTLDFSQIPDERKTELDKIAAFVEQKIKAGKKAELIYICTHNSRRSHFGQIWGATAAAYYGIETVLTYSGGTEATAFNERSVATIKRAGFLVEKMSDGNNPKYNVLFSEDGPKLLAFSKKYEDHTNPQIGFCAIMTCSHASESCPVVFGASLRVSTPYEDPKAFDGTPEESKMYDERCKQIATESFYIFSNLKNKTKWE